MLQLVREDHSDCSESEIGAYRVREFLPPMRGGETRAISARPEARYQTSLLRDRHLSENRFVGTGLSSRE